MHDLKERTTTSKLHGVNVRKPTGKAPFPLVVLEGSEKSGKTYAAAAFSGSPRTGATYWMDIGEGSADEYGAVPGADFLILQHDGTWPSIMAAITAVVKEAQRAAAAGEPPVVFVIDSVSAIWALLNDWVYARAKLAPMNKNKGPNDEIRTTPAMWADRKTRWDRIITLFKEMPGIVVLTARASEKLVIDENGRPEKDDRGKPLKHYKLEAKTDLGHEAHLVVRMARGSKPMLVHARRVGEDDSSNLLPEGKPMEMDKFSLDWLVFDFLGCDENTTVADYVTPNGAAELDPARFRDLAIEAAPDRAELKAVWHEASAVGVLDEVVVNETGDDEALRDLITRLGQEQTKSEGE